MGHSAQPTAYPGPGEKRYELLVTDGASAVLDGNELNTLIDFYLGSEPPRYQTF